MALGPWHRALIALAGLLAIGATAARGAPDPAHRYLTIAELRARYADPAGHIAEIGGAEVYYKDEGKGPAILMVHGSRSSLSQWDGVAAKLTGRYRVIRYDIPGYGLSGRVSDAMAAKVQPTDIAETLLTRLGVDRITFVGVSSGGTLGFYLAAKRPDLVERLILSNTPANPVKTDHLKPTPRWAAAQKAAQDSGFEDQHFWNEYLTFFAGDPARISDAKRREYYEMNRRTPEKHPIAMVARVADHDKAVAAMGAVRAPTLLIWGGSDPLLTPPAAAALAGHLKSAQVSTIFMPDVGHYPPLESPERFAQLVAAFIEAATPAQPAH